MFLHPLRKSSPSWRLLTHSIRHERSSHSFPTTKICPSPTCACAETPEMPPGLPIDHSKPLNGTMASYAEQVLICTGRGDWSSKIEEENSGDNLAADIGELVGKGGMFADPFHHLSILNTSLPPSLPTHPTIQTTSAYLLPSFKYIPFLPRVSFDSVHALVKGHLLPTKLHPRHDGLSPIHRDRLLRNEDVGRFLPGVRDVREIMVLICGHGGRDARCGITGPILRKEFEEKLPKAGYAIATGPVDVSEPQELPLLEPTNAERLNKGTARVGLISHIGGHKFAGNVIVYLPPGSKMENGEENPLAGCGVWYGRVEPKHVEGIVKETVMGGRVIEEHFRGGVRKGGKAFYL